MQSKLKLLITTLFILPMLARAQNGDSVKREPPKLGPNPVIIIDSVTLTRAEFVKVDSKTIAKLTLLGPTYADRYGLKSNDGVILATTIEFERRHYINYFRQKLKAYDSLYTALKTDTSFQYIVNDKIRKRDHDLEWSLGMIRDDLFISIELLTADDLKNKYNITDKTVGFLIRCRKPKDTKKADILF